MTTVKWFVFIGLEIHAQILSQSKLFSCAKNCVNSNECAPNTCLDWLDYALPGTLPVLNEHCVEQAMKTALAINASLNMFSRFDRKNYFYPDLPLGYQITQHHIPLAEDGYLNINIPSQNKCRRIKIKSLHMEQDAGKLLHNYQGSGFSAVDFNRAGVPLMEIVTDPDMKSAEEAIAFIKSLRAILRYLGTCDGDMQNGSLRIDVNISVSRDPDVLGVRTEIKNLNSLRFLKQAVSYEIERQTAALSSNADELKQQTRLFDENTGKTVVMRDKEDKCEYRYFTDPDLPPLCLTQEWVDKIKASLPELPQQRVRRFLEQYKLNEATAETLVQDKDLADFYECSVQEIPQEAQLVANWLLSTVVGMLHKNNLCLSDVRDRAGQFGILIRMLVDKTITNNTAKQALEILLLQGGQINQIVQENDLSSLGSREDIRELVVQLIKQHPKSWQELLQGKDKIKKWFVGQLMRLTRGRTNPTESEEIISQLMQEEKNSQE